MYQNHTLIIYPLVSEDNFTHPIRMVKEKPGTGKPTLTDGSFMF